MSNIESVAIEQALIKGDLTGLTTEQRLSYYHKICESLGLNPMTKPFDYISFQGKTTLYAKRDCTDQLRKIHRISIEITKREVTNDICIVTAHASNGLRHDESTGAVPVGGLKGDALANAFMKAETKAKRRVTLSICGLGILDESEIEPLPREREKPIPKSFKEQLAIGRPPEINTSEKFLDSKVPKHISSDDEPITQEQIADLKLTYIKKGISETAFNERLKDKYSVNRIDLLSQGHYQAIMEAFLK